MTYSPFTYLLALNEPTIDATVINRNLELLPHHIGVVISQETQHIEFEKVRPDLLRDHQQFSNVLKWIGLCDQ
jgi:hypothetical protein